MAKEFDYNSPPFTNFNQPPQEFEKLENGLPVLEKRWFRSITRDYIAETVVLSDNPDVQLIKGELKTIWLGYTPEYTKALEKFIEEKANIT